MLDENNYICKKIWADWDTNFIYDLKNDLQNIILKIVDKIIYELYPAYDIAYNKVTVNQIETNKDLDVGIQKSLYYINRFSDYINTDIGLNFQKKINAIALKHRIPYKLSEKETTINKNETVSIQFEICKGLKAKIYRKTKDHIRFELTFEKTYLKRKFRKYDYENTNKVSSSTNIKRIIKPVMEFSKDFFKDVNITDYLINITKENKYNLVFNQLNPVYEYFRSTKPEINDMIDCIGNKTPITDKETIDYIGKNKVHTKKYKRKYNKNGRKFLVLKQTGKRYPKEIVWKNEKMIIKKWGV